MANYLTQIRSNLAFKKVTKTLCFIVPWSAHFVLAFLLIFTFSLLIQNQTYGFREPDPAAYRFLAHRFMNLESPWVEANNNQYWEHMWLASEDQRITSKYAPGYPLLLALAGICGGDKGMHLVSPIAAIIFLLGCFLLFRVWCSPWIALTGVMILLYNPMIPFYGNYFLTHISESAFVVIGMWMLLRWHNYGRNHQAIVGGLALGFSMSIRHTSALMCIPLLVLLVSRLFICKRSGAGSIGMRQCLFLGISYAIFPLLLMAYHTWVFGGPFTTGYRFTQEQNSFSLQHFASLWQPALHNIYKDGAFLSLPLSVLGIFYFTRKSHAITIACWIVPLYLIYASYYWYTPNMAYTRFFVSLLPALVACMLQLVTRLSISRWHQGILIVFLLTVHGLHFCNSINKLLNGQLDPYSKFSGQVSLAVDRYSQDDALLFVSPDFFEALRERKNTQVYSLNAFDLKSAQRQLTENKLFTEEDLLRGRVPPRGDAKRMASLLQYYGNITQEELLLTRKVYIDKQLAQGKQVLFVVPSWGRNASLQSLGADYEVTAEYPCSIVNTSWRKSRPQTISILEITRKNKPKKLI